MTVQTADEWRVAFFLSPVPEAVMSYHDATVLMDDLLRWCEGRKLGVGGSFEETRYGFLFRLGVCGTAPGQLIERATMTLLLQWVAHTVAGRAEVHGDVRLFDDSELEDIDIDELIERVTRSTN